MGTIRTGNAAEAAASLREFLGDSSDQAKGVDSENLKKELRPTSKQPSGQSGTRPVSQPTSEQTSGYEPIQDKSAKENLDRARQEQKNRDDKENLDLPNAPAKPTTYSSPTSEEEENTKQDQDAADQEDTHYAQPPADRVPTGPVIYSSDEDQENKETANKQANTLPQQTNILPWSSLPKAQQKALSRAEKRRLKNLEKQILKEQEQEHQQQKRSEKPDSQTRKQNRERRRDEQGKPVLPIQAPKSLGMPTDEEILEDLDFDPEELKSLTSFVENTEPRTEPRISARAARQGYERVADELAALRQLVEDERNRRAEENYRGGIHRPEQNAKTAALNHHSPRRGHWDKNGHWVDEEHRGERYFRDLQQDLDYAQDLYEARTGSNFDDLDVKQQTWHVAVYNISHWMNICNYDVVGDGIHDVKLWQRYDKVKQFFGVSSDDFSQERMFRQMAALYTGFAPDTHWFIFRDNQWTSGMPLDVYVQALELIKDNIEKGAASPFAYRPDKPLYMGGTKCVSIPVIPENLLDWMVADRPGNQFAGTNKNYIRKANEEAWTGVHNQDTNINGIHDIIVQDKSYPRQQRQALECMIEAIENINGTAYDYSGQQYNFCLSDLYDIDSFLAQTAVLNTQAVMDELAQHHEILVKAENRMVKKMGYEVDENGKIVSVLDINKNPAMYILKTGADFIRGWALLTNPIVSVPATIEKVAGMADHWGAQKILNVVQGRRGLYKNWKPLTQEAYQVFNSDTNFSKALENAIESFASGRRDQIIRAANNQGISSEKYKRPEENPLLRFAHFVIEWGGKLSRGLPVFRNADVRRWFEYYWLAMCQNPNFDLTLEQLLELFQNNPEDFLNQALQTREGQAATTWVGDTIIGGANPLCEAIYCYMSKHRVTDALTTLFVDQYFVYGFSVTQKLIPLSHTTQFLLTHALTAHDGDPSDIRGMLVGSHLDFTQGLLQNLLLDAQWIGTRFLGVCLMLALFSLLGLEPPDDKNLINVYGEWKVGGVAIQESWIWRDLCAPIFLPAMAIGVATRGGDPFAILVSGLEQTVQDMPWFNIFNVLDVIINWRDIALDTQDDIDDRWEEDEAPEAYSPEWWRIVLETEGLNKVSGWFEPTLFTQIYRAGGQYQYSNTMIYSTNPTDAADEVEQTTYEDAALRKVANKHPFAALALDIMNGTFWPNNGTQKTGYFKWERPLTMISDPVEKVWAEHFTLLTERQFNRAKEDGDKDLKEFDTYDSYRVSYMLEIRDLIKRYDYDASLIDAQGIVLPRETRQLFYEYCCSLKEFLYKEQYDNDGIQDQIYGQMKAGAISYDEFQKERQDAKDQYDENKDNINKMINALFSIRSGTDKYYVRNTGYRAYYTDADTGAPVNELEYGLRGLTGRDIEKNTYATGIAPQVFPLWNAVPDTGNYNQESGLAWQTEDTDLDQIKKTLGNEKFDSGFLKGENVWDVISQGVTKDNQTLVTGQRGLTPVPEDYDKIDTDKDKSEMWDPYDAYSDNDSSSSSSSSSGSSYANYNGYSSYFRSYYRNGYSRSYSRGYSRKSYGGYSKRGSSYTQKVYSRGSYSGIKTNYANTSYSKNLKYSKYGYLYPKVSTKGSRWGYRRQDM